MIDINKKKIWRKFHYYNLCQICFFSILWSNDLNAGSRKLPFVFMGGILPVNDRKNYFEIVCVFIWIPRSWSSLLEIQKGNKKI